MRKYNISVNGTKYEVEIEEITAFNSPSPAAFINSPSNQASQTVLKGQTVNNAFKPAQNAGSASLSPQAKTTSINQAQDAEEVLSPMPGTILSVNVKEGQSVKAGDVLMILEAMKMENEIMCPRDGVVSSINIASGASVESGTLLCVIA